MTLLDYGNNLVLHSSNTIEGTPPKWIEIANNKVCSLCSVDMDKVHVENIDLHGGENCVFSVVHACPKCGFFYERADNENTGNSYILYPSLQEFKVDDIELPKRIIFREINKNENILNRLHPSRFEKFVGDILQDTLQTEVFHVGKSGDGGIDLYYACGVKKIAVQVKRRELLEKKEGVALVREFLGAMLLEGYDEGKLITSGGAFTAGAKAAASRATTIGLVSNYDLIDQGQFIELMNFKSPQGNSPWEAYHFHPNIIGKVGLYDDFTSSRCITLCKAQNIKLENFSGLRIEGSWANKLLGASLPGPHYVTDDLIWRRKSNYDVDAHLIERAFKKYSYPKFKKNKNDRKLPRPIDVGLITKSVIKNTRKKAASTSIQFIVSKAPIFAHVSKKVLIRSLRKVFDQLVDTLPVSTKLFAYISINEDDVVRITVSLPNASEWTTNENNTVVRKYDIKLDTKEVEKSIGNQGLVNLDFYADGLGYVINIFLNGYVSKKARLGRSSSPPYFARGA